MGQFFAIWNGKRDHRRETPQQRQLIQALDIFVVPFALAWKGEENKIIKAQGKISFVKFLSLYFPVCCGSGFIIYGKQWLLEALQVGASVTSAEQ